MAKKPIEETTRITINIEGGPRTERRIDIQLPLNLFRLPGHVAVQPEQVVPNNTLHGRPLRAGHYRDRVTSQLRDAA